MTLTTLSKALREGTGMLRAPQRSIPLVSKLVADRCRTIFGQKNLYSYATRKRASGDTLNAVIQWISDAQQPDGGIPAYYSLLTGYSKSYPEVTGYIIPTLYDFSRTSENHSIVISAERATKWLLSLQMTSGAFPAGLQGTEANASIFNTGQILQGLVRAYGEAKSAETRASAIAAGDWLLDAQEENGSWSGSGAYQGSAHTYYSMVAWSLAELSEQISEQKYGLAAERNLDWVLSHVRPDGWIDGIHLRGHPNYLHFIAYVLQGALECAILRRRSDAVEAVAKPAWILLRKFETNKYLAGAYGAGFAGDKSFACLTGNAQMSCVWLRLYEVTSDLRYLNAALKMNELLKDRIALRGARGIAGGVSGSYPIWGRYQPLRYISWGCKFFADALLLEDRLTKAFAKSRREALRCAS